MKLGLTHVPASIILALSFVAPIAAAGPLEDAEAASKRHDYATAMRILRPLAIHGDDRATADIGLMYYFGQGVPVDFVSAYLWFSSAAAHGESFGAIGLEDVASKMTDREVAQAEVLKREWRPETQFVNTSTNAETWVCDVKHGDRPFKQEWSIANGRMTALNGKVNYRLAHYD